MPNNECIYMQLHVKLFTVVFTKWWTQDFCGMWAGGC